MFTVSIFLRSVLCGAATFAMLSTVQAQTKINVGSGPTLAVAGVQLAIEKGYFEEEGLEVSVTPLQSGAAVLASLVGGSLHFVPSNIVSIAVAQSRGIKLQIVSPQTAAAKDRSHDAILVRGDSPIKRAKDLEGKTIAVNAVNSIGTLTASRAIEKDGGDYKSVKWIELPQGDAMTALATGNVDAIWIVEPFVTIGENRGFRNLLSAYNETHPGFVEATMVATESFLKENPEVGAKFARAMQKTMKLGADNPEEIRDMLPTYLRIDEDVLRDLALPVFHTELNTASIQEQIDLATRYGYIKKPISMADIIWKP